MVKKYTLHLDTLIVLCLLFLASVLANIYIIQINSDMGEQLIGAKTELLVSQLNLTSRNEGLAACLNKLDSAAEKNTKTKGVEPNANSLMK